MKKYILAGGFAVVSVVLDLLTKNYIVAHYEYPSFTPVTSYFNIAHVHNSGAAFGFLAHVPEGMRIPLFVAITIVAVAVIGGLVFKAAADKLAYIAGLGLVLGGAVGNFIDRIRFGYVVDFLDFFIGSNHWPAFNVADIAISVGVGLLLLDMLKEERKERAGKTAAAKS